MARLAAHLDSLGRVLLGYSGGVDSALLGAVAARTLGSGRFLAVLGRSASLAVPQYRQAVTLAREVGIPLLELDTRELDDPRYTANPTNRCYFCKVELWTRLGEVAARQGFDAIIDGTNADDLGEHRPGLAAAAERQVRSPLAELGWTKTDIRAAARALGLPIWDAPAAPCLSSRIRYGLSVTPERLRQVDEGEAWLRALGVQGDLRVRHLGATARIEVGPEWFALVDANWGECTRRFRDLGFEQVERSQTGYRRGGLLTLAGA